MVIVAIKRVSKYANNFYDQEQSDVSTKKAKSKTQERNNAFKRNGDILSECGVQCCTTLTVVTVNWLIGVRPLCYFIAISITHACGNILPTQQRSQ
jgi:hypothetical protein